MEEIAGSRETAKMVKGAQETNLGSDDKDNLGSREQSAKF